MHATFIVAEAEYLEVLAGRFRRDSRAEAASEIEGFLKLLPSLPTEPYMPKAKLLDAILVAFPVYDILIFSMSRRTFRRGKYAG